MDPRAGRGDARVELDPAAQQQQLPLEVREPEPFADDVDGGRRGHRSRCQLDLGIGIAIGGTRAFRDGFQAMTQPRQLGRKQRLVGFASN